LVALFARVEGLNRSSPVPLYYQLQEVLKQDIDAGYWQPGQLLPSEGELSTGLGVSRTVIRGALDVLAQGPPSCPLMIMVRRDLVVQGVRAHRYIRAGRLVSTMVSR